MPVLMRQATLADATQGRENNFNLLRMMAATAVLFSHCFVLATGKDEHQPFYVHLGGITLGSLAVDVFFVISGFLVCGSLLARQDVWAFWKSRLLRVYPGLIASIALTLITAVVLLEAGQYSRFFSSKELWLFIAKDLTLLFGAQTKLPLVLDDVPYKAVMNGSLWTLPYEVRLYLGLGLLWYWIQRLGQRSVLVTLERAVTLIALTTVVVYVVVADQTKASLRFTAFFSCGVAFYVHRQRIPLRFDWFVACIAALAASVVYTSWFFAIYTLVLPYLILYVAYARVSAFRAYNRVGDYSYGMYIYAFPVQQVIAKTLPGISAWQMLPLAFAVTLLLAAFSWRFVEAPALRRKSARPT
jgi:peptidoglycan/LPS O-acetylase OafA/YrhL